MRLETIAEFVSFNSFLRGRIYLLVWLPVQIQRKRFWPGLGRSETVLSTEAFSESKRMRLGKFCADIRDQRSARVARQVEIWSSDEAQTRLKSAATRLKRSPNTAT